MFDSVDTVYDCVRIATGVLSTLAINPDKMRAGLSADMLATDLAEYLVRKGEWGVDGGWVGCVCCLGEASRGGAENLVRKGSVWCVCVCGGGRGVRRLARAPALDPSTPPPPSAGWRTRRRPLPRDAPHQRRGGEDGRGPRLRAVRPLSRRPAHHPPPLCRRRVRGTRASPCVQTHHPLRCPPSRPALAPTGGGVCARSAAPSLQPIASPSPPPPPLLPQVWDFARSADMRDTEGGASKRSLLEQVGKLRAYLDAE